MTEAVHVLPDSVRLPHRIRADDEAVLREIVAKDSFGIAVHHIHDIKRYITWVALAAASPERRPLDVLKEHNGGSFRGRYAIEYRNRLAGYLGCAQGTGAGVLSLSYFTFVRGEHLSERAVNAFIGQPPQGITELELTIADDNLPSQHVAASCGFVSTNFFVQDSILNLNERVYRRPIESNNGMDEQA